MTVTYQVQVLHTDRAERSTELSQALAEELSSLGLHRSLTINVTEELLPGDAPAIAVVLTGPGTKADPALAEQIRAARESGLVILPVVDSLSAFQDEVPETLSQVNGFEWSGPDPEVKLARVILEQLGIEEHERRVFISHRRSDGLAVAQQLHDELTHVRFDPFIDRFAIRSGEAVQPRIADALEAFAFLLLLETPEAHLSEWVFDETDYALAHTMGMLIVRWPGNPNPVPGSAGIPRLELNESDFHRNNELHDLLTAEALDRIVRAVETAHAHGLVRRRRMLVRSVQEAAESGGAKCTSLKDWTIDVIAPAGRSIVAVAPRLPESEDLHRLDEAREKIDPAAKAVLVHAARRLDDQRRLHLEWVTGKRDLALCPENTVGGLW